MKINKYILTIFCTFWAFTILQAQATEKTTDPNTKTVSEKLISIPVKTEEATDVVTIAVKSAPELAKAYTTMMGFEQKTIDFGKIKMGETRTHTFNFKNTGAEPMEIEIVSACECTEVVYTQGKIEIGGTGFVKATFHSDRVIEYTNRDMTKDITIILKNKSADTGYPIVDELFIKAFILPKE